MDRLENALEVIGQGLDCLFEDEKVDAPETYELLSLVREAYVVVAWPDSQEFMDEDWFDEEAILDVDGKFGSSAYLIPIKYVMN
jgi:hypothetical protein